MNARISRIVQSRFGGLSSSVSTLRASEGDLIDLRTYSPSACRPIGVPFEDASLGWDDLTSYTHPQGSPELRSALAAHLGLSAEGLVITQGASAALLLAFLTLFEPGSRVAIPSPGFPAYGRVANLLSLSLANYSWAQLYSDPGYARGTAADAVVLNSPHNPTGQYITREQLEDIARALTDAGRYLIFDDAYSAYGVGARGDLGRFDPLFLSSRREGLIYVGSLGKSFFVPGLRLGFIFSADEELIKAITEVKLHALFSTCAMSERIATFLLSNAEAVSSRQRHAQAIWQRRSWLENLFTDAGIEFARDGIGPYMFLRGQGWLRHHGIIGMPGPAFGASSDEVRLCLSVSEETWNILVRRLAAAALAPAK